MLLFLSIRIKPQTLGKPVQGKQGTERTLKLKQAPYTHVNDPETIQLLPVQLSLKSAKQPHSPAKKNLHILALGYCN